MSISGFLSLLDEVVPNDHPWTVWGTIIGVFSLLIGIASLVVTGFIYHKQKMTDRKMKELVDARTKKDSFEIRKESIGSDIRRVLEEDRNGRKIHDNTDVNIICKQIENLRRLIPELVAHLNDPNEVREIMQLTFITTDQEHRLNQIISDWLVVMNMTYNEIIACDTETANDILRALNN